MKMAPTEATRVSTWLGRIAPAAILSGVGVTLAGQFPQFSGYIAPSLIAVLALADWALHRANPLTNVTDTTGDQHHLHSLMASVLPIWARQVDTASRHMTVAMDALTARFAGMSQRLRGNLQPHQEHNGQNLLAALTDAQQQLTGLVQELRDSLSIRAELIGEVKSITTFVSQLQAMAVDVGAIARQTNLLSLNAAIEAARAGEQGKGFAVVAKEVRHLSTESARTGERIVQMIDQVNQAINRASQSIDTFTRQDTAMMDRAGNTIEGVVSRIRDTADGVVQDAEALRQESQAVRAEIDEVLVAVQSQDRVSQMLQHASADQSRLLSRLGSNTPAGPHLEPQAWLAQLKTTYTTPEELAVHEGRPVPEPVLAAATHVVEQDTTFF